jgi:hypothetical protein
MFINDIFSCKLCMLCNIKVHTEAVGCVYTQYTGTRVQRTTCVYATVCYTVLMCRIHSSSASFVSVNPANGLGFLFCLKL